MDYYGLLFLYYLKGLSGKSILRLFFNIEVGGTEQLLPENTSTPTTTPILADIQYPDGLRTDQYFTYRETPTTVSNKARIKTIKGNTLVWNQLVQNGNFADTSLWRTYSSTGFSVSNNVGSFTVTGSIGAIYQTNTPTYVSGHKYLVIADFYVSQQSNISVEVSGTRGKTETVNANTWYRYSDIVAPSAQGNFSLTCGQVSVQVRNVMCFDLTQMGLDISNPSDFTSLFPLSYCSYNQGSLLSFNGNGIKTVGFNQWDEEWEVGAYNSVDGSKADNVRDRIRNKNPIRIFPSVNYYKNKGLQVYYYDASMNFIGWNSLANQGIFTPPSNAYYMNFNGLANSGTTYNNDICINISDTSKNGTYEPYTSSTLSLPISTYFPNGMDGVGTDYDELTNTKSSTRMARVDLGSLNWGIYNGASLFYADITGKKNASSPDVVDNIKCARYPTVTGTVAVSASTDKVIGASTSNGRIFINDLSYTSASAFKSAMSGVYLVYPLATPTETPITTEDANEALSLLMGKSVSSNNANQLIDIITKGE